jgi:hypothetical protein
MRFDLNELNPGAWFDVVEGKPEEGRICLRVANGEAIDDIRAQTIKKKVEYRRGQRFETEEVNDKLYSELLWDYTIVGWEGIADAEGKEIPCTRANKSKLMRGSLVFQRIVADNLDKLNEDLIKQQEAEEKNS